MTPTISEVYKGIPQVPEGFQYVDYRNPFVGELFLSKFREGTVEVSQFPWDGRNQPRVIVRPAVIQRPLSNLGLPGTVPFLIDNIKPPMTTGRLSSKPNLQDIPKPLGRFATLRAIYGNAFPRIPEGYRKTEHIRVPEIGEYYLSIGKDVYRSTQIGETLGPDHRRLILTKLEVPTPVKEKVVRVVRVLEYIGPESWIKATLDKSGVGPNGIKGAPKTYQAPMAPDRTIRELSTFTEEVK